ncbi:MAG: zinc ribbon domain-containing protein [Actinomycetota bacterium]|nr:zinc ribbon domain-containing protein [Actinomycetota bacterium]
MATYDYRCRTCERVFEVRRGMTEDTPARCPGGHADVARVWSAVSVVGAAGVPSAPSSAPSSGGGCCGGGCCG